MQRSTRHGDNILFGCGDTEEECQREHHENLKQRTGSKAETYKKKLQLCLSEVLYMGHRLTKDGLGIGPAKVKAITDMPRPNSKKSKKALFRVLVYLTRFLAEAATPLQLLL